MVTSFAYLNIYDGLEKGNGRQWYLHLKREDIFLSFHPTGATNATSEEIYGSHPPSFQPEEFYSTNAANTINKADISHKHWTPKNLKDTMTGYLK